MATPSLKYMGTWNAQVPALEAKLKSLFNRDLQDICVSENLSKTGVKSVLIGRIVHRESIRDYEVAKTLH